MASSYGSSRKRPVGMMIIMGIVSVALYGLLLSNQGVINNYVGRGGLYAFLPIAVAFIFSMVHGSFTGKFWTVLGIEAAKKKKEVK
jgi:hypothetical protein